MKDHANPLALVDLASKLDLEQGSAHTDNGVGITWSNVNYSIATKDKSERKQILNQVSGNVNSGTCTAIMGPSGSGKTSLLNVLAGRVPVSKGATLTGAITVLTRQGKLEISSGRVDMADLSAYVEQDDALFALSTVTETLMFAAQLRLPKTMPLAKKKERVNQVISELGLLSARDTIIGNAMVRGVSGGERKRVSIGLELLHDPNLVFMDEPTSGLDSFQAANVMNTLKSVALKGRTVICSIHQPRSSIYAMLDSILLLEGGKSVYFGPAGLECENYFAKLGFPLPRAFNPADFFLDVISVDQRSEDAMQSSKARVAKLTDAYAEHEKIYKGAEVKRAGAAGGGAMWSADSDEEQLGHMVAAEKAEEAHFRESAGFWGPFFLLLKRTWREQTRDKGTLAIKHGMALFFTIVFGVVYFDMGNDQTSIMNRTGILFFQAMNQAFGSTIGTSQIIPVQLKVVNRERASKLYPVLPYYLATFLVALPLELLPQIICGAVIYYMTNLRPGWEYFFTYIGVMACENFVGIALGMVLSCSFTTVEMAPQIAPAVVVLFLMFSGYFLNEASLPAVLGWMKYLSFIRYAFQALCVNEFKDAEFVCAPTDPDCVNGNQVLERLSFDNVTIVDRSAILLAMIVGWNIIAYCILILRRPKFLRLSGEKAGKAV
jgi:ABC-type multidrug transport system ATPase subunit